jgi:hypothetical protein
LKTKNNSWPGRDRTRSPNKKGFGQDGIRTRAPYGNGALIRRLRPTRPPDHDVVMEIVCGKSYTVSPFVCNFLTSYSTLSRAPPTSLGQSCASPSSPVREGRPIAASPPPSPRPRRRRRWHTWQIPREPCERRVPRAMPHRLLLLHGDASVFGSRQQHVQCEHHRRRRRVPAAVAATPRRRRRERP